MTIPGVTITGPTSVFASRYDVTGLAADAVAWAASGAAELLAARNEEPPRAVTVDRVAACAAFAGERLLRPIGWSLPPIWDPLAGDYRTADGWVRLHTNYPHHRASVLAGLGLPADCSSRDVMAAAVAGRRAGEVEAAVVAAGGPAAALRSPAAWAALHSPASPTPAPDTAVPDTAAPDAPAPDTPPAGEAVRAPAPAAAPSAGSSGSSAGTTVEFARPSALSLPPATLPFAGVRVLDLTRVIAGPVATRYLAAYGADVLRIDPPGFPEVPALLPEVTPGKRCTFLDLRSGRDAFLGLVRQAHVLVCGLRPEALDRLGLSVATLRAVNPGLITARLNAYGWTGPWTGRRGFDSLVQMSCGIAYLDDHSPPAPLPVQALDHATGYALAGWIGRALAEQLRSGHPTDIRTSLVATASALTGRPRPALDAGAGAGEISWPETVFETTPTAWGPVRRVRAPGAIEGVTPRWTVDAGPLGRHPASFG